MREFPTVFLIFLACSSTPSSNLATTDIRADLEVTVHDNDDHVSPDGGAVGTTPDPSKGWDVFANLSKDDSLTEQVDLTSGDSISYTTNLTPGQTALTKGSIAGFYDSMNFPDPTGLTDVTFILTRPSGQTSAPSSHVTVPPAIVLTAPKQGDTVSWAAGGGKVTFTWSNPVQGARMNVYAHPCDSISGTGTTSDTSQPDTGSWVGDATLFGGAPSGPQCFYVNVIRRMDGAIDPAFHGGSTVRTYRHFDLSFTLTP